MKTLITALTLSFVFFGAPAIAGSGHDHGHGHSHEQTPVNQAAAEKNADKVINSLIKRDKIDKSWASVKASSVEKKIIAGHAEWLVIFINKKVSDADKQKLYVFLTVTGQYIAANYTGE